MSKPYKRYSYAEKKAYWNKQAQMLGKKHRTKNEDERFEYAVGFLYSTTMGGISPKFNELNSQCEQYGQMAGFKAYSSDVRYKANKVLDTSKKASANRPRRGLWG